MIRSSSTAANAPAASTRLAVGKEPSEARPGVRHSRVVPCRKRTRLAFSVIYRTDPGHEIIRNGHPDRQRVERNTLIAIRLRSCVIPERRGRRRTCRDVLALVYARIGA